VISTLSSTMTPLLLLLPVGLLAEEVVLITGGYNGSNYLSTNEVLGFPSCQVSNFPGGVFSSPHYGHSTALTSSGLLLTCGGILQPRACLVLDPASGIWEKHSNLDQSRISSTPVNLPQGLFLIGDDLYDETTSSFLANGSTEWVAGPKIPGTGATGACAVPTSETSFLVVGGRGSPSQVVEYHTDSDTWTQWPDLVQPRKLLFCAKVGEEELLIAGGEGDASTTIMNLVTGEQRAGGDMTTARGEYFRMVVVGGKVLAVGGDDGHDYLTSVEEWDPEMEEWVARGDLEMRTARYSFGAAAVPNDLVCGSK